MGQKISDTVSSSYAPKDFAALFSQRAEWIKTRPLSGMKILDATPIFRNTLAKYDALLEGGAKLTVTTAPTIPFDSNIVSILEDFSIEYLPIEKISGSFDVILDCGAACKNLKSRFGYAELTRTGAMSYASDKNFKSPVFSADDSIIKEFETTLGTGDGFIRAMQKLNLGNLKNKTTAVFGCGKVGRGIILAAAKNGAKVVSIDRPELENIAKKFSAAEFIDMENRDEIYSALKRSGIIISATGVRKSINIPSDILADSSKILVNMGVEEEFGDNIPNARVLNSKRALNFILEEPTHLKYIDPTLALHNFGATELISKRLPNGLNKPDSKIEEKIISQLRKASSISPDELSLIFNL